MGRRNSRSWRKTNLHKKRMLWIIAYSENKSLRKLTSSSIWSKDSTRKCKLTVRRLKRLVVKLWMKSTWPSTNSTHFAFSTRKCISGKKNSSLTLKNTKMILTKFWKNRRHFSSISLSMSLKRITLRLHLMVNIRKSSILRRSRSLIKLKKLCRQVLAQIQETKRNRWKVPKSKDSHWTSRKTLILKISPERTSILPVAKLWQKTRSSWRTLTSW